MLQIYFPLQVRAIDQLVRKKNIIRELYYRGEEKHGERERERERERSMGRGETIASDSEGVRTKERKSKRKREKVKEFTMRERMRQKIMFTAATDKYNIYRRCNT